MSTMNFSRRSFLGLSALGVASLGGVGLAFGKPAAAAGKRKVLCVIFQRGAVDGLSMVVPWADKAYYAARPSIAIGAPGSGKDAAIKLDERFGLHPALDGLMPHWSSGKLAMVHAVGSPLATRSHFDAQDYVESGTPGVKSTEDGFLNRALEAAGEREQSPVRAIGLSPNLPRILSGGEAAVAFASIQEFRVAGGKGTAPATARSFEEMYASAVDEALRTTAASTFDAVQRISAIKPGSYPEQHGASYPGSPLGRRMRQMSQLIQAEAGVEVLVTDCGGWDTHAAQGNARGQLATRLRDLGDSLGAFATDLKDRLDDVCVVTVTEFGRTVKENGTGGTDHGHGSVMMVLGGKTRGRKVHGKWKGLAEGELFEGRDLAVTTDHRAVFGEVLRGHLGVQDLAGVFPGFGAGERLGVYG
jgi:uncharacterized protein (DUF1501 family)